MAQDGGKVRADGAEKERLCFGENDVQASDDGARNIKFEGEEVGREATEARAPRSGRSFQGTTVVVKKLCNAKHEFADTRHGVRFNAGVLESSRL